jgi:hypothetical protein
MARSHSSFFIQSVSGDFELFAVRDGGGLGHYLRDNSRSDLVWNGPGLLFGSHLDVTGAAALESGIGGSVNFHAVYREGSRLAHDWGRRPPSIWHGPTYLPGGLTASGTPAFIESRNGEVHVIAPVVGGIGYWKGRGRAAIDASNLARPPLIIDWSEPVVFGEGEAAAVALLYGAFENVEAVVRVGNELFHYWQDNVTDQWSSPFLFASGVSGQPCWLESKTGNFELVSPLAEGGLAHWTRNNAASGFPWSEARPFGEGRCHSVGLIQATWDNFELIVQDDKHLCHYWSEPDAAEWHGPYRVTSDVEPDFSEVGRNEIAFRSGCVGIHASLLKTGDVLLFGFGDDDMVQAESRICNPATCKVSVPGGAHGHTPHVFCGGHAFLPDGSLLVAGGHFHDIASLHLFHPEMDHWMHAGTMPAGRWYPTCCPLPGGRVLIIGGTAGDLGTASPVNNTIQIYDPASGLSAERPLPVPFSRHFAADAPLIDTYPLTILLPSGKVLVHSRIATRFYDPGADAWDAIDLRAEHGFSRTYPGQGNGVLLSLLPDNDYHSRFLIVGGCGGEFATLTHDVAATNTAEILDLGASDLAWRYTAPMAFPRVMCDAVLLPDGTVLVVGGSSGGGALAGANPVLDVELFDPSSETWRVLAPIQVPRLYHASAILTADGRVMVSGKDGPLNPFPYHYAEHRVEMFSPPYLFRGPRPAVQTAPPEVGYGEVFLVRSPEADSVASAVLMRPDSATHSVHMDQRRIGLTISGRDGNRLTLVAPPNSTIAPEGHYMLFLLTDAGVPSIARFVHLG